MTFSEIKGCPEGDHRLSVLVLQCLVSELFLGCTQQGWEGAQFREWGWILL